MQIPETLITDRQGRSPQVQMSAAIVICLPYGVFQAFRLLTLVVFAIFMVECSVYGSQTTVNCVTNTSAVYNTPGCGPYCWKGLWVGCSVLTSSIWLAIICVPKLRPGRVRNLRPGSETAILRSLLARPYFWWLSFILLIVMAYDGIIQTQRLVTGSEQVEVLVIVSKITTTVLVFQLNFTYPPSRGAAEFHGAYVLMYYLTMLLYVLDYLCKFVELSIRISYKLYTVNTASCHKPTQVLDLMMEVVDASLYHTFATFFWNKMFRGRSDVLMTYSPDLGKSVDADSRKGDLRPLLHRQEIIV